MLSAAPGPPPGSRDRDWRRALATWADGLWEVYHRHPWILAAASSGPPADPGQLAWLEAGLSALGATPNFGYPDYTTFQFVWILSTGMALAGFQAGLALSDDFETGFARRMMLGMSRRTPLVTGYVGYALARAVMVAALLFAIGLIAGMEVSGNPLQVAAVVALALLFNLMVTLWSMGVALRLRGIAAGPAIQMPVFILMFLVPVYTPRSQLTGWVHAVANVNPITTLVEASRGLIIGKPVSVALAFAFAAGLVAVTALWALTGLRSAQRGGG
jgi:ABC-2 type transport system permease protein